MIEKVKVASGAHSSSYAVNSASDFFEAKRPGFKAAYLPGVEVENERTYKFTFNVIHPGVLMNIT